MKSKLGNKMKIKTPEQLSIEIKNINDKIKNLEQIVADIKQQLSEKEYLEEKLTGVCQ